jgi:hypothetical protein
MLKTIDPARVGLSKTTMTTPCARKGWYGEHVRDSAGARLRFPMPEKVHFGSAVDSAHLELVYAASAGKEPDLELAIEKGMESVRGAEIEDRTTFEVQLRNAMTLFLRDEVNGLARIPLEGIRFQGANGISLKADDVIGTPDILLGDGSVLDVKAVLRRKTVQDFYRSAEMPVYTLLAASQEGVLPPRLIYQVYVRNVKPYWDWIEVPGTAALVALGRHHAAHWRAILAGPVELAAFDTTYCADCGFREAITEVGHGGCEVGLSIPVAADLEAAA